MIQFPGSNPLFKKASVFSSLLELEDLHGKITRNMYQLYENKKLKQHPIARENE